MSRCKACNTLLKDEELFINKNTNLPEDLCLSCRKAVFSVSDPDTIDPVSLGLDVCSDDYTTEE